MKKYKFTVWFSDGTGLIQYAISIHDAAILAMGKKINNGEEYSIDSIETEKGVHFNVSYMQFERIKTT